MFCLTDAAECDISPDETKKSTCNTDTVQREAVIPDISVRNVRSDYIL